MSNNKNKLIFFHSKLMDGLLVLLLAVLFVLFLYFYFTIDDVDILPFLKFIIGLMIILFPTSIYISIKRFIRNKPKAVCGQLEIPSWSIKSSLERRVQNENLVGWIFDANLEARDDVYRPTDRTSNEIQETDDHKDSSSKIRDE